jgi:hypothetical protein
MTNRIDDGVAAARAAYAVAPARYRRLHDAYYPDCDRWETWTVNEPLATGGRADNTYVGCRTHAVAVLRHDGDC